MLVKLFVVGRPGSGKSTAIRRIIELADRWNYPTHHIKDYDILLEMYQQDVRHEKFCPADWNGFDVINFSVLDTALQELEDQVHNLDEVPLSSEQVEIIMIEFARDDYVKALSNFSSDFLKGAYFLFVETDLETCVERIHLRRNNTSLDSDHHSVSDAIMRSYYRIDNWSDITQIPSTQCYVLKNVEKSLETFKLEVGDFIQGIFDKNFCNEPHLLDPPSSSDASSLSTSSPGTSHKEPVAA